MDLYISRFKFQMHKRFIKEFNNMSKNKFNNLKQFKKNIIKIDNCFWNLNMDFKGYCIHLIQKSYTFARSNKLTNYKNSMENIQYNSK